MELTDQIERREGMSPKAFAREYFGQPRPVIVTDALAHWPALGRWSPDFFRREYGEIEIEVDGERLTLGELIDRIEVSTPEKPAPYLRNQPLSQWPQELQGQVSPPPAYTRPNWLESRLFPSRTRMTYIEAYIGGEGARFPVLHYDGLHTHAYLMQLYGDKEYIAFAPDQTEYMYPPSSDANTSRIVDVLNPDLESFPLFDRARGVRFQLHPGEMLFVPGGWWHTARILNPSVTVSINGVNKANGAEFRHDYAQQVGQRSRFAGYALSSILFVGATTRLFEVT
jgi:Cupin-like domain